jgi:hypothetical protein
MRGMWVGQFADMGVMSKRLENFILHIQISEMPFNSGLIRQGKVKYSFTPY